MPNQADAIQSPGQEVAWLRTERQDRLSLLRAGGHWGIGEASRLYAQLRALELPSDRMVQVDAGEITVMDTAGAWVLHRTIKSLRGQALSVEVTNANPSVAEMLDEVARNDNPCEIAPPSGNAIANCIALNGESAVDIAHETAQLISFLGSIFATLGRTVINPRRLRLIPLVHHMQQVGLNALPIVCLISFLIGVVLAYQGASQLQKFGAEVFVPDFSPKNSVESDYLLQTNSYRNFREATKIQGVFPFRAVFRPAAGGFARFRRAIARRPVSPSSFPCFATHR